MSNSIQVTVNLKKLHCSQNPSNLSRDFRVLSQRLLHSHYLYLSIRTISFHTTISTMSQLLQLYRNKFHVPADPQVSFAGKTVVVTGANVGLGLEAAKKYATLGCDKLVLGVRTLSKGENAKQQILSDANRGDNQPLDLQVWHLDMNSFASIKQFADRVNSELSQLDVALLNAGVIQPTFVRSPESWEEMLQVNTLSTVFLGLLLLPKLEKTSKNATSTPYLSFVSSGTHKGVDVEFFRKSQESGNILEYLNNEKNFPGREQYANTKLLLEFAKASIANLPSVRSPDGHVNVIVNSCCPGLCQSDLAHNVTKNSRLMATVAWLMFKFVARTSEEGSRTLVSSTTLGVESHGKWWQNDTYPNE